MTGDTTFTIDGGGACTGSRPAMPPRPATTPSPADDGGNQDTATLTVTTGPSTTSSSARRLGPKAPGVDQAYAVEGFDSGDNASAM